MRALPNPLPRFALAVGLIVAAALPAVAQEVDLALVLAVDVSRSMDRIEQQFQRAGYVRAFQDGEVIRAIESGAVGRIAVTYVEWSTQQIVVVPWTIIDGSESAWNFAGSLSRAPISRLDHTSISGALAFSGELLASWSGSAVRQAIDVSGDGPNNAGLPLQGVRTDVLAKGITINGLPMILANRPRGAVFPDLDLYYQYCVIGGPNAFELTVRTTSEFARATRRKLILEISSADPPAARTLFIRTASQTYDCSIAEQAPQP